MPDTTADQNAPEPPWEPPPGPAVRALLRRAGQAALATHLAADDRADGAGAWPYASLVLATADHDGSPLEVRLDRRLRFGDLPFTGDPAGE